VNFDVRLCVVAAALAIVAALVPVDPAFGQRVKPASPDGAVLTRASQDPAIIRAQLELGLVHAREALRRLRTAPTAETPATLDPTIHACYRQIAAAQAGVNLKQQAAKNARRFIDPLLDMASSQLHQAATHIRNARHVGYSVRPDRPDVVERVTMHLEATISFVEQAMDLI
jgi:hypothetical protein